MRKEKKLHDSFYLEGVVIDKNGKPVPKDTEEAVVLSKAYNLAARKHLDLQFKTLVGGFGLIGLAIVIAVASRNTTLAGLSGIFGVAIILYGLVIHKPHRIASLSKAFAISYVIPYKSSSAIIFDPVGIIDRQTIK